MAPDYDTIFGDNYCKIENDYGVRYLAIRHDRRDALKELLGVPANDMLTASMWCSWSGPWATAMLLARYIRENPGQFKDKCVADLGAGCGIVAITAAQIGAKAIAIDAEPLAAEALRRNAKLNGVDLNVIEDNAFDRKHTKEANVLIAADMQFYMYRREGTEALLNLAAGKEIYLASSDYNYKFEGIAGVETITDKIRSDWGDHCRFIYRDARAERPACKTKRQVVAVPGTSRA